MKMEVDKLGLVECLIQILLAFEIFKWEVSKEHFTTSQAIVMLHVL